jgi:hypothetical protein
MTTFFKSLLFACIVVAATNASARACINDREINKAEREFKSSYPTVPSVEQISPDELTPPPGPRIVRIAAVGVGAGLILAAGAILTFTKRGP